MSRTHTQMPTPIGQLTIVAEGDAVTEILFDGVEPSDSALAKEAGMPAVLNNAVQQLDEYFAGQRTEFDLQLNPAGTEFQQSAWRYLVTIPYGTTTTYGAQARALGDANKSRAVGAANGKNPIPIVIPCHRVVGASGSLTGFAGGIDVKAKLLAHESGQAAFDL